MKDTRLADRNQYVVKSNELIQKSRYSLSLQEQRIVLFAISKIKPTDDPSVWYQFSVADICHSCGLDIDNGSYYPRIKAYLKRLRDTSWFIEMADGSETTVSWFDKVSIQQGTGTVKVRFDSDLQKYLFELKTRYTQYKLQTVLCFKSRFSIRLYELLKSYNLSSVTRDFREKQIQFDVEELKRRLDAETYERYPDFKRRVLATAVDEINKYSEDIKVEMQEIRRGRKVIKVVFIVSYMRMLNVMENSQRKRQILNR